MHKTVFDQEFKIDKSDLIFNYQESLTHQLDSIESEFNQAILNEIVLWKVNRFADFDNQTLNVLNSININQEKLDIDKTKKVLTSLLKIKGVQLAMASTILRFKNPNIYQIIDQRVYRIIYKNKTLNIKTHPSEKNINNQIDLYILYLKDLKKVCSILKIPFNKSDRILFMADKRINKNIKLNNY